VNIIDFEGVDQEFQALILELLLQDSDNLARDPAEEDGDFTLALQLQRQVLTIGADGHDDEDIRHPESDGNGVQEVDEVLLEPEAVEDEAESQQEDGEAENREEEPEVRVSLLPHHSSNSEDKDQGFSQWKLMFRQLLQHECSA
jgi:hypothetical protein